MRRRSKNTNMETIQPVTTTVPEIRHVPDTTRKPVVIHKKPDICPLCDTLNSLRTYKTQKFNTFERRMRKCTHCGHKFDERTPLIKD